MKKQPLYIETKTKCNLGKSVATKTKDNREFISVLKFSSIKHGLGYWKYVPEKLLESAYIFRYPTLEPAFKNILNNEL